MPGVLSPINPETAALTYSSEKGIARPVEGSPIQEIGNSADIAVVQTSMNGPPPAVLIVDDDPWFRKFARNVLENAHHVVVEAECVEEGKKLLRMTSVSLLIADIMMPEVPGFSLISTTRREFPAMKILAVSGTADGYSRMARLSGADSTLGKPVTPERFLRKVQSLLS